MQKIWKEYFEDLYDIDTHEQDGMEFGEEIGRAEVEVRVGKIKNGKAANKDEITGKVIKGRGGRVEDWIWRLCNMAFQRGFVPEDWSSAVTVPLYEGKGKRTDCNNYRGISLLSVVGKLYVGP